MAMFSSGYVGMVSGSWRENFGPTVGLHGQGRGEDRVAKGGQDADLRSRSRCARDGKRASGAPNLHDVSDGGRGCGVYRDGHAVAPRERFRRSDLREGGGAGDCAVFL